MGCASAQPMVVSPQPPAAVLPLLVADFNQPGWYTNTGHPFGAWQGDPGDPTQFFRARLVESPRVGDSGYSLQLEYDAESPNPAYGGFWMKLGGVALRPYRTLSFVIKGDADRGFTTRLKVELKDRTHAATYELHGITGAWTRMRIPLKAFVGIEKLRQAEEFVLVLDQATITQRTGTLYLEDLVLENAL